MHTSIVPQIKFEDVELHPIVNPQFDFLLTNKEVAKGYGISESTLRSNKNNHADELVEGKHYIIDRSYRNTPKIMWTKRGIIRLGFFIKSERAKKFRDFIEDLTLAVIDNQPPKNCPADQFDSRIAGYKGMIARKNKEIERLRFELIQANEKLKEYEVVQPLRAAVLKEYKKQIETQKHQAIMLEHNLMDLAGSYARLKEELQGRAETLRFIADEMDKRIESVDYFLQNIYKLLPKAKDVADNASARHAKEMQWQNVELRHRKYT